MEIFIIFRTFRTYSVDNFGVEDRNIIIETYEDRRIVRVSQRNPTITRNHEISLKNYN